MRFIWHCNAWRCAHERRDPRSCSSLHHEQFPKHGVDIVQQHKRGRTQPKGPSDDGMNGCTAPCSCTRVVPVASAAAHIRDTSLEPRVTPLVTAVASEGPACGLRAARLVLRNQSKRKSHEERTSSRSSSQRPYPSWLSLHDRHPYAEQKRFQILLQHCPLRYIRTQSPQKPP